MRYKSNKLARLEKNRFSIFTEDLEHCYICKRKKDDLHELLGGIQRKKSMQYGLVIPVCRRCHGTLENDEQIKLNWKIQAEKKWLEVYAPFAKEDFIREFGKNYL